MPPFQSVPNYKQYIKQKLHQTFEIIMKKYTTEPAKVHLNSVMETIRNRSIMKNIGQIQNFRMNTGDINNSRSTILYFKKMPTNRKNRYLLFMFQRETIYH